jgi:regulatory protein
MSPMELQDDILFRIRRYCAYQERCSKDVRQKLKELGSEPGNIPGYMKVLAGENFFDDRRFANSFIRGKFRNNHWGKIKIRFELLQKGIPDQVIREELNEIDEQEYLEAIRNLIEKKFKDPSVKMNPGFREKIATFVAGKGFEAGLVWQMIREMKLKQ